MRLDKLRKPVVSLTMKIYKLKIIIALLAFSLGIIAVWSKGGFSYLGSLFESKTLISETNAQTKEILPESNSSKDKSVEIQGEKYPFQDYSVDEIYKGKNALLKLKRDDKFERERFQWAIDNQNVDFAGHYIVTGWSCGMWCSLNPIIDAKTGKVYWWNGIISVCFPDLDTDFACNESFSSVEYRIDSKLIVFFGYKNGKAGSRGFHYYKFENGRLIHLKSILVKEQRGQSELLLDKAGKKTDDKKNLEK